MISYLLPLRLWSIIILIGVKISCTTSKCASGDTWTLQQTLSEGRAPRPWTICWGTWLRPTGFSTFCPEGQSICGLRAGWYVSYSLSWSVASQFPNQIFSLCPHPHMVFQKLSKLSNQNLCWIPFSVNIECFSTYLSGISAFCLKCVRSFLHLSLSAWPKAGLNPRSPKVQFNKIWTLS